MVSSDKEKQFCDYDKHARMNHCLWALDKEKNPESCETSCLCLGIKRGIIMLRRNRSDKDTFKYFDTLIQQRMHFITENFNTRWMLSVLETYADAGNPIESRNAMIISAIVTWERFAQTILRLPDSPPKHGYPPELWDGVLKFGYMDSADTHKNLFRRLHILIKETPHIYVLYREIMKRMLRFPFSVYAEMTVTHPRNLIEDIQPFLCRI